MLTVLEAIKLSTEYLEKKNVESPRTNAELLLAKILNCKRLELYLAFDKPLNDLEINRYREFIKQRGTRIPLQYIIGKVEFYGLDLNVNNSVLIPRPETELLVELIISNNRDNEIRILDIGSGSGNIALALAKNLPLSTVTGVEISEKAIEVSRVNACENDITNNLKFIKLDIKNDDSSFLGKFDLIVSNPPYVSLNDFKLLEPELKDFEPRQALTDELNGLSFYEHIINLSRVLLNENGKLYFEIGKGQHLYIFKLMEQSNFQNIQIIKDFSGIERIIIGELK